MESARSTVVSVRLDENAIAAVDCLVNSGLAQSRSEAVAQFVAIGVKNASDLLQQAGELAERLQQVRREMFDAVKSKDVSRVRELLEQDASLVSAVGDGGETPVLTAIYYGAREVTDLLLARGATLSLFEAAAVGAADRIREILSDAPTRVADYSHDGWTALHLAAFFGHPGATALLLGKGAPVSAVGRNGMANTPLHAALASNRTDVARILLEAGAEVDLGDGAGWTPLHLAAANGNREMVEELLQRGARPDAATAKGETALSLAEAKGHAEVAGLLR
ncbi:MAG TPA: ankyrin repeat domain-containing protein [Symbiobacteriaceae bacterium]|nr:ankyrin repeat domain-containing protein [Symbiobacteriaceae bacterium]